MVNFGLLDKLKQKIQHEVPQSSGPRPLAVPDEEDVTSLAVRTVASPREVKVKSVQELGTVRSTSTYVNRDTGFQGQLANHIVITYADTMWTDSEWTHEPFRGMTCNSIALATENPCQVIDPVKNEHGFPVCGFPPNAAAGETHSEWATWLTNVIETSPGQGKSRLKVYFNVLTALGIVYFILQHRPGGVERLVGAGAARVTLDTSKDPPIPRTQRIDNYWWDGATEPWYGDVCALKHGGYVYAYGHKDRPFTYLARVKTHEAFQLESYEYWNGESYQKERPRGDELGEKQSIFWQVHQGQMFWSKHHNRFLFVYCDNFWSCRVLIKTSPTPEGPWSEPPIEVHKPQPVQEGGNIYSPVPHTYYDPSHKSLVITYTNHPNTIQAIRVVSLIGAAYAAVSS